MLYKLITAFLLFPAACIVYKRNLFPKLFADPRRLFGILIDNGYNLVYKRNLFFNLCIFYPMCAGIMLYHKRSLLIISKIFIKKTILFILRKLPLSKNIIQCLHDGTTAQNFSTHDILSLKPLPDLSIEALIEIIKTEEIKIVSFDIFDTLLTRPITNDPRDIFYLIAAKIDKRFGVDFIKLRWDAEAMLGDPYATIDDIYTYIESKYNISHDIIEQIKAEELNCERQVLYPRQDMIKLCYTAHTLGKRLIATSDMYLPSEFLLNILHKKGFQWIEKVYVSSEYRARKTDHGALFDIVINNEQIDINSILHIGDNPIADVKMPLEKGIAAIHVPSILQHAHERGGEMFSLLSNMAKEKPLLSIIFGHSLARFFDKSDTPTINLDRCRTMEDIGNLIIGPLTTILCIKSRLIAEERGYSCVYYASRDGWLPFKIHKALEDIIHLPKAIYFHAGRRAYFPFMASSFIDYAFMNKPGNIESFTLENLLKSYFANDSEKLLNKLSHEEQNLLCFQAPSKSIEVLKKVEKEISSIIKHRKECAQKYYNSIFPADQNRFLVFDIGYSGSISVALSAITKKKIDKLYCWQSNKNKELDKKNGTSTFTLINNKDYAPYHLVLEELFSPSCGGTIGFTSDGQPIQEDLKTTNQMSDDLELLHKVSISYATSIANRLSTYIDIFSDIDLDFIIRIFKQWFQINPFSNRAIFQSIVFPDPVFFNKVHTLEEKLDTFLDNHSVFSATGFDDIEKELYPHSFYDISTVLNIGIHIHIYNPALAQEFVRYLCKIHTNFDLFITYTKPNNINLFKKLFNKNIIPYLNNIQMDCTPNRGRDVAPWIIATAHIQQNYDLFCHVHAKESSQSEWGASWRAYLLDNLLRPEAIAATITAFSKNKKLGLTFPQIYPYVREAIAASNLSSYGTCCPKEYDLIINILERMNFQPTYGRSEQFFSAGTMFWYRPQALKTLFTCGLKFEDFPKEPIGIDGTLAHALERVPTIVCERSGYEVRSLTLFKKH